MVRVHDADPRLQSLMTMLVTGPDAFLKQRKNIVNKEPQVQALRHGSAEASDASDFVSFFSGATGAENALLTAMLVDAFDISLCLPRLFDKDSFDACLSS